VIIFKVTVALSGKDSHSNPCFRHSMCTAWILVQCVLSVHR